MHQVEAGLRMLDERCRIYQYVIKRAMDPIVPAPCHVPVANEAIQRRAAYLNARRQQLSQIRLYLVILYETPHVARRATTIRGLWQRPRAAIRSWLSSEATIRLLESELDQAIATLYQKAEAFEVQVSECGLRRLGKAEAFRFFRCLVNDDARAADAATLPYDTHLDYFVSDSQHVDDLRFHRHVEVMCRWGRQAPFEGVMPIFGMVVPRSGTHEGPLPERRDQRPRQKRALFQVALTVTQP